MKKAQFPEFNFASIGVFKSPFVQRFGIPHQASASFGLKGFIQLKNDPDFKTALRELHQFSHIWIVFVFHNHGGKKWKPSIRPPRLGGNKKVGLFASRSPHRPNPVGISAVKIDSIELDHPAGPQIHVSGVDLLDDTPILDIKPYIPLADSLPEANSGWADIPIKKYKISWSTEALLQLNQIQDHKIEELKELATHIIELDPRPAFQKRLIPVENESSRGRKFGIDVLNYDFKYQITEEGFEIYKIELSKKSL